MIESSASQGLRPSTLSVTRQHRHSPSFSFALIITICKTRTGSRGNLILSLNETNETIKTYPVPAVGYIDYPGFIGACQPKAFAPDFEPCANPCKTRLIKLPPASRRPCVAMFSRSTGWCRLLRRPSHSPCGVVLVNLSLAFSSDALKMTKVSNVFPVFEIT